MAELVCCSWGDSSRVCGKTIGSFELDGNKENGKEEVVMNSDCKKPAFIFWSPTVTNIEIHRYNLETKKDETILQYSLSDGIRFDRKKVSDNDMRDTVEPDESVTPYFEDKGTAGLLIMGVKDVKRGEHGFLTIRGNYKGEFNAQVIRDSELPPNFAY